MNPAAPVLRAGLVTARTPRAVPLARARLIAVLRRWRCPPALVDDAALLLSELLSNAVHHGDGPTVTVHATCREGVLRCRVQNHGTGAPVPSRHDADLLADHGRGLRIVDAVATRWGHHLDTRPRHTHRSVWFELHTSPHQPDAGGDEIRTPDSPHALPRRRPHAASSHHRQQRPDASNARNGPETDPDVLRRVLETLRHL